MASYAAGKLKQGWLETGSLILCECVVVRIWLVGGEMSVNVFGISSVFFRSLVRIIPPSLRY